MSEAAGRRVGFVLGDRPHALVTRLESALAARGVTTVIHRPPYARIPAARELLLLRAKDARSVAWAECWERAGRVVVPSPGTVRRVKDRVTVRSLLKANGLPV